jgi:hypothetical protein
MTPERQNMTKPETVTQEAIQAAKDYLRGNGPWKDSEIGITEDDYLVRCFAKAIQAAEQRGMERERELCVNELLELVERRNKNGSPKSNTDIVAACAAFLDRQAIRQGEQA